MGWCCAMGSSIGCCRGAPAPQAGSTRLGGDEVEGRPEKGERVAERSRRAQPLAAAQHDEFGGLAADVRRLDDTVDRPLLTVPEHREQRHAVAVVDRVVAPYAA